MLDGLTLDQLRVFITIAEEGSFRAAAKRLGRAQSAVSFAIANLEAQLAVALFDRTSKRPLLTPQGMALREDARTILLKADGLRARGRGLGQGLEIALSIAVDPFFPHDIVATALATLRASHPSVGMKVLSAPMGGPLDAVVSGAAVFGISLSDELRDPVVEMETLGSVRLLAVSAPAHPLAMLSRKRRLKSRDLVDHLQIVVMDPSSRTDHQDLGVLSTYTWRVATLELKAALLCQGVGWGSLPEHMALPLIESGTLARVRPAEHACDGSSILPAFICHRLDTPLGPAATILRAALTDAARSP